MEKKRVNITKFKSILASLLLVGISRKNYNYLKVLLNLTYIEVLPLETLLFIIDGKITHNF